MNISNRKSYQKYDESSYSPYHIGTLDITCNYIKTVLIGNRYLLKSIGRTFASQLRDFNSTGVKINRQTIDKLLNGQYRTISMVVMFYFVKYWDKSIHELWDIGNNVRKGIPMDDNFRVIE